MTQAGKENLTHAALFNSIAKKFFEAAAYESQSFEKNVMNQYAGKCNAIENHIMTYCNGASALQHFRKEVVHGDTLQLANMITMYLSMTPEKRDAVEELIERINRGEIVEFIEPECTTL